MGLAWGTKMDIKKRLSTLRELMKQEKIDYYFISNSDPHQNEYLPEAWQRYQYISGFTGSNAEILIGLDKAYFWTDGRYTEQAKMQLSADLFETFIYAQGGSSSLSGFILQNIRNARVGVDPQVVSIAQVENLRAALHATGSELVFLNRNLVDASRIEKHPLPHSKVFVLPERYTGESAESKLSKLRAFIKEQAGEAIVLNELPSIAWLLNMRGKDIPHNPVFLSYLMVTEKGGILFIDNNALSAEDHAYLKALNIEIHAYNDFYATISALAPKKVLLEGRVANQAMVNALQTHEILLVTSPVHLWKACKNATEIKGAQEAHRVDAIALVRFFAWFNQHKTELTEVSLDEKLLAFRKQMPDFQGTSFDTIAGYGPHGAIIHYRASPATDSKIGTDAILLIDSGGQYLDGTTDITRTIHLGHPSDFEKQCYTLVLKGHLALQRAVFPQGTRGEQLDILARQYLYQEGLNYGHGTGHGVGAFLCVHEGPQRISTAPTTTALMPNMIVSNEPGLYFTGKFGIRIENLVYVKKADVKDSGFGEFYTFENLTLVPYALNLIDRNMLTPTEIKQINDYHARILEVLKPSLEEDTLQWLVNATKAI